MAPPIRISIPHNLGQAEAKRRLMGGLESLKAQLAAVQITQFSHDWKENRLNFNARGLGQSISGTIDVQDSCVVTEVQLPAFLQSIAGPLAKRLSDQTQILLTKK